MPIVRRSIARKSSRSYGRKKSSRVGIVAARMMRERSFPERVADFLTGFFGTLGFLYLHGIVFVVWVVVNLGVIPGLPVFDAYPFGMLTTIVSLEAIFLSIIVLMSENRAARVAELREEIDFHVNVQAEREITKVLHILQEMRTALNVKSRKDPELDEMLAAIDVEELEEAIEEEME